MPPSLALHAWAHAPDQRYVQVVAERRAYPSDLSDARWALIEPMLSVCRAERRRHALNIGRPPGHNLREIMNAILYVDRTGAQWCYLPHDFPPWETVYGYFAKWQKDGVFAQLTGVLRKLVRQKGGKDAEPSACVIDARNIKTSTGVPAAGQGTDAAKKIVTPKGWTVERIYGWLMFHRRLTRDYEALPARSEAMIHLAMTDLMARRLTRPPDQRSHHLLARPHTKGSNPNAGSPLRRVPVSARG